MIKYLTIAIVTVFSLGLNAAVDKAQKFAYVDLQMAMESVKEGERVKEKLEKEFKEKQGVLQARESEIKKMSDEYEKKQLVMSEEKKVKEQQNIQKKMMEYRELLQQSQMAMQKRQMDLTKPLVDKMRAVISDVAKAQSVDFVFEKNQGGVLYAKDANDITNDIIKKYNDIHK
ncbi:MAG: OmpH family outer membrane protein [Oligoflexia bacterium]|nr:OmpH family outer membrane protein [Oligoflexia bacterium]